MDHLDGWRHETARFADLLDDADLARPVPACPEWDVAGLAAHLGRVMDRFARIAGERLTEKDQIRALEVPPPPEDHDVLPGWFRERVAVMDDVLTGLDPDEPVWNFTRAPHVGAWVPRRMHHEAVVHRHDLEEAVGSVTPIDSAVARDGIDELLVVLAPAGARWDGVDSVSLQVTEDVANRTWRLRLEPGERATKDEITEGAANVIIRGEGAPLLLALWRRRPLDTVTMTGDEVLANAVLAAIGR